MAQYTCSSEASPLLFLLLLPLLLLIVSLLYLARRHHGSGGSAGSSCKPHLPPGSFGLPLLGETIQFALFNSSPVGTPRPFLSSRLRRYGPVFKTNVLGRPTVVSMDPELNRYLLLNEERLVRGFLPRTAGLVIGPSGAVHGAAHKKLRELATAFLGPAAIQAQHLSEMQDHALWILDSWTQSSKLTVDAQQEATKFFFTFMIKKLLSLKPKDDLTFQLMRDFQTLMAGFFSVPINLPGTLFNRVIKARKRVNSIITDLVRARKKEARAVQIDFLDLVLQERNESGQPYSEQDAVNIIFLSVVGSFHISSVLLTNIIRFLSDHPEHAKELRLEHTRIQAKKNQGEKLTWDDFKQMEFTEKVIQETLRLAGIAALVTRDVLQDIEFKGFTIPKGWKVMLIFSMVNLDSNFYSNPLKFDPCRWKRTINNSDVFTPFGGGRRSCLGAFFAKAETSMFLHHLVTRYKWERVVHKGQVDMISGLTLPVMPNGLEIQLESL